MTDLDSPKKNNDCYFFYYSTCAKGDSCTFRHEPSALGCETMCSFWKEGKCLNVHCNFRHMELRKNRKAIPCYWESQPMGCLKSHCPFMHQNPRPSDENSISISPESPEMLKEQNERKVTAVDSLVVNFEEESDNESGPTFSPNKNRIVTVKTLEEIKLEKIQAESAAYYSYNGPDNPDKMDMDDMKLRIFNRMLTNNSMPERIVTIPPPSHRPNTTANNPKKRLSDDQLANILGDESLRKKQKIVFEDERGHVRIALNNNPPNTRPRPARPKPRPPRHTAPTPTIRVKTLAEIRAEKGRAAAAAPASQEPEVTSTSCAETPAPPVKLRRDAAPASEAWEAESVSSRAIDERLLLESDDDVDVEVTLKAEEEFLNEIDDYLGV